MAPALKAAPPLTRTVGCVLLGMSCLLVPADAGTDLLNSFKHFKPSPRLLEQSKQALEAAASVTIKKQDVAVKAVDALQKAVSNVKSEDLDKVKEAGQLIQEADLKKAQNTLKAINPQLVEALRHTNPERIIDALNKADPQEIEDVFRAIDLWHWWYQHWYLPTLVALIVAALTALCAWRRGTRKRSCVVLEQSDTCLLQAEEQLFTRAALVC
mmetsp:Transcript_118651/g.295894  ORF Transcript_118651/g.295894 Transcript_118651/m.295894 type:complete len:213 (-) Transcript_118651:130-768(-)